MIAKTLRFGKKRGSARQSILLFLVFLLVFGGIGGFFVFQNIRMAQKRAELQGKLDALKAQAAELSARTKELQANIQESQSEGYQEKILREQGLYKKPGEEVITVLPPEGKVEQKTSSQPQKKRVWWNPRTW